MVLRTGRDLIKFLKDHSSCCMNASQEQKQEGYLASSSSDPLEK